MRLPGSALLDPAPEQLNLPARQLSPNLCWWHVIVRVCRRDSADELALLGLAGDDREVVLDLRLRVALEIETQVSLPLRLIRPVTLKAGVGQDWANVAIELNNRGHRLLMLRRCQSAAQSRDDGGDNDWAGVHRQ